MKPFRVKNFPNNFTSRLKLRVGFSLDLSKKKQKLGEALYCSIIQSRKTQPLIIRSQPAIGTEAQSQMNTPALFLQRERMDE